MAKNNELIPERYKKRNSKTSKSVSISLCAIAKNEENKINKFLAIHSRYFDEILIADSGSTDKTIPIAEQYAKIIRYKPISDFSEARNFVIRESKSDWILMLDVDEIIYPHQINKLKSILKDRSVYCYLLPWFTYHNYGIRYDYKASLFRNIPEIYYNGIVHEQVLPSVRKNNLRFCATDVVIHHFPDFSKSDTKNDFYDKLLDRQVSVDKFDTRANLFKGFNCLYSEKNELKARTYFLNAIRYEPLFSPMEFITCCVELARMLNRSDPRKARNIVERAIKTYRRNITDPELSFFPNLKETLNGYFFQCK